MSVYGGDSWGREAQYRKRRVDDLLIEDRSLHSSNSSYKKLSNGKYACLVCPRNPVLDTPLMLSMHCKGSHHQAAESKLKERELLRHDEINKRLALSESPSSPASAGSSSERVKVASKPLVEQTQKAVSEVLCNQTLKQHSASRNQNSPVTSKEAPVASMTMTFHEKGSHHTIAVPSAKSLVQWQLDLRGRREKELKFIEAGWKRDCHGKWYKDESVEFDSDEEDPNVILS